jgi:putative glutamine amidotransferase
LERFEKKVTMRIGLTYTGSDKKHENYVRWLQAGDGAIEVVRIEAGGRAADDLDGLVLSGGVDIAPEFYSGENDYAHAPANWERARDLFEMEVLEQALEQRIPVFGVCRGLQLVNVVLGGTLVQDLGEAGDGVHEGTGGIDKRHGVWVERGSMLGSILGVCDADAAGTGRSGADAAGDAGASGITRGLVNSAHHQAIGRLAEGLRVSCRADDGTIEGVEWAEPDGQSFLLAVQWHPERMFVNGFADAAFYGALRDRFIKEIKHNNGNH